jgi:hypothetical protein
MLQRTNKGCLLNTHPAGGTLWIKLWEEASPGPLNPRPAYVPRECSRFRHFQQVADYVDEFQFELTIY